MDQRSADADRIVNTIREAFRDVEYPGDDSIAGAGGQEEEEITDALRGKDWRDIDARFLNDHCIQAISFLQFQAYRYFLPAFLVAAVKDYERVPEIVGDLVSSLLEPVAEQKVRNPQWHAEGVAVDTYTFVCRMNPLTRSQVEVIVDVLKLLCDDHTADFPHDEPQLALNAYWLKRLETERNDTRQKLGWGNRPRQIESQHGQFRYTFLAGSSNCGVPGLTQLSNASHWVVSKWTTSAWPTCLPHDFTSLVLGSVRICSLLPRVVAVGCWSNSRVGFPEKRYPIWESSVSARARDVIRGKHGRS